MPPEVSSYGNLVTPVTPLPPPVSPKSSLEQTLYQRYWKRGIMRFTKRKLLPILVFILSGASILRLLKISIVTSSSSPPPVGFPPIHQHECSSAVQTCSKNISHVQSQSKNQSKKVNNTSNVTEKEMRYLMDFVSHKVPCNLLVFGLEHQYLKLASLNSGGLTIFLDDNLQKLSTMRATKSTAFYKVEYQTVAIEAYNLLKHARKKPYCSPKSHPQKASKCKLALKNLPKQVYETRWDVVVVDGPRGNTPDSPGRMASIYTAGILARNGNVTHVIVHDVDRMIEKWFSWEFLCEENLVSSKGRLWNFGIAGKLNTTIFCGR